MKQLPFTKEYIEELSYRYPTPFYVYNEQGIRDSARRLIDSFAWNPGFKEYFAVKALPNPAILSVLKEEGCGADCSSLPELLLAERVGLRGEEIMFTSNNTPAEEFKKACELGAIINLDDISHLEYLERQVGLPSLLCFRYNPGTPMGNAIIGSPHEAKFGLTKPQLFEAYRLAKQKGVTRFGLHTMVASNELNPQHFLDTAKMLFSLAGEVMKELNITFEFVNLGGGLGIPYRPSEEPLDLVALSSGIHALYEEQGLTPVRLCFESGRYVTGPHGYLISSVRHLKNTYKQYVGLDASMADLMRPGMYGAYHYVTILGKEEMPANQLYDLTGSLCENNDKFAIDRNLPEVAVGDVVVIHDVGAHGHAMGFNYNGKLRHAELLLKPDGSVQLIRRAETLDDYFTTLNV